MILNNIMAEVTKKSYLRPRAHPQNWKRKDSPHDPKLDKVVVPIKIEKKDASHLKKQVLPDPKEKLVVQQVYKVILPRLPPIPKYFEVIPWAPPIFDLSHELSKWNILVPLSKLAKPPSHKKHISEFLSVKE